jgi:MoxR-like ATPase
MMTSSLGFAFTKEFKEFCINNKHEIINLALGIQGVSASEEGLPNNRPAPECPVIDGVVGMEAQVTAFHSAMSAGKPSMLVGPTGCGKTFLVRQYHKWDNEERKKRGEPELPLVIHTFHQESSPTEIIGKATLENGNVIWKESEFMKTFANGGTYFADEFNFAPGGAHAPLFAALNGDEDILVPEAGKTYTRHKDFKFVAACNPASKYGGRQPVDKALASRFFASISFGYLPPAQEKKLLMSRIDTLTDKEAEKVVSFAQAVRKAELDGHLFIPLGTRDALHIAELLKKGFTWDYAVEYGFAGKSDNEDQHSELIKIAGSAPSISFDDEAKLKETVKKLKEANLGLQDELNNSKTQIREYVAKLDKFKAALS